MRSCFKCVIVFSIVSIMLAVFMHMLAIDANANNGTGYLDVSSSPLGVTILINDVKIGNTPLNGIEVESGTIKITARKKGYANITKVIKIGNMQVKKLHITLRQSEVKIKRPEVERVETKQYFGKVVIIDTTGGSIVKIDGESKGTGSMEIDGVPVGNHTIDVGKTTLSVNVKKYCPLVVKATNSGLVHVNKNEHMLCNSVWVFKRKWPTNTKPHPEADAWDLQSNMRSIITPARFYDYKSNKFYFYLCDQNQLDKCRYHMRFGNQHCRGSGEWVKGKKGKEMFIIRTSGNGDYIIKCYVIHFINDTQATYESYHWGCPPARTITRRDGTKKEVQKYSSGDFEYQGRLFQIQNFD